MQQVNAGRGNADALVAELGRDGFVVPEEAMASLERYLQSVSGSALFGAIYVLSQTARVKIGHDASWEGIDALKRMRKKT